MTYRAPVADMMFTLRHVVGLEEMSDLEAFAHVDLETVEGLLEEAGRFASEVIAPTNAPGDRQGSHVVDGGVVTPEEFPPAYERFVEAGWAAIQFPAEFGGGDFPSAVALAVKEMLTSANLAFSLAPLLTTGAVVDLLAHGSEELQQTYLPKLVTGEWAGTMNLSEPQAGSDVGALSTRAVPADDGTYRITGTKIWITYGEHDLAENICHLVLARLPDAPAGTKGISLFLVPKFLPDEDGEPGERNDVHVVSVEDKLGIHASPTCVMEYGANSDGAVGFLVGEPHEGMRQMFTMMNDARLGVGLQGLAIAERAYQAAVEYALVRRQGRAPGDDDLEDGQSLIVRHPDVRRQLLTIRAQVEAMRALTYRNAAALDRAEHHPDEATAEQERRYADLLTPLSKAWCTDLGVELASIALQVHGGMGYVEETGVAQHLRDARIAPIYEGTNGIQAIDLVGRKLPMAGGAFVKGVLQDAREVATALADDARLADAGAALARGLDAVSEATEWLVAHRDEFEDAFAGATPYLRMLATVLAGTELSRGVLAATRAGEDGADLDDKRAVLHFYCEQVVPQVHGLAPAVTAGADDLYAIDAERLTV